MRFLTILTLFTGAVNAWLGAEIRFGGKVGLLFNYYADERNGKLNRAYGLRAGMILFAGGLCCLCGGAAGILIRPAWMAAALMLTCLLGLLVAYRVNYARSFGRG